MSFVFFLLSVVSALLTTNVHRPLYRHPKWIVPSFLAGWLAGELALHVIAAQVIIAALFALFGALHGFWGALGLIVFAVSWISLSYHYFSGYKAKVLMDSIVIPHRDDEDITNWSRHAEIEELRLLRPFSTWKDDRVELIKNITYDEIDGFNLKLDIRRPRESLESAPVLLQIHGGAWTYGYGSKNEQGIPLMVELAKQGWICVAIDYRLSPQATFPDHIVDCKKALAWIREHIKEYGGDPNFVVATGGSAGGHLCSLLALTANQAEFQPGFEDKDTSIQGCVPFYGIYDLLNTQNLQLSLGLEIILRKSIIKETKSDNPEVYAHMSPLTHIHKDAPPFLLIHGDKDSLTSLGEAQYFASELDEVSNESVEFAEISGAQHAFDVFTSLRSEYVLKGVAERVSQWHRDYLKNQP